MKCPSCSADMFDGEFEIRRDLSAALSVGIVTTFLDKQFLYFTEKGNAEPVQLMGLFTSKKAGNHCPKCNTVVIINATREMSEPENWEY